MPLVAERTVHGKPDSEPTSRGIRWLDWSLSLSALAGHEGAVDVDMMACSGTHKFGHEVVA